MSEQPKPSRKEILDIYGIRTTSVSFYKGDDPAITSSSNYLTSRYNYREFLNTSL